jgi:hypothetical protein
MNCSRRSLDQFTGNPNDALVSYHTGHFFSPIKRLGTVFNHTGNVSYCSTMHITKPLSLTSGTDHHSFAVFNTKNHRFDKFRTNVQRHKMRYLWLFFCNPRK